MTLFLSDDNGQKLNGYIEGFVKYHDRQPIFRAAEDGKREIVEALLNVGIDKDCKLKICGETLLMCSAKAGHMDVVKMLLGAGANVNIKSRGRACITNYPQGFTALHWASYTGRKDIAIELLRAGALLDGRSYNGSTSLLVAVKEHHLLIADALLCEGAGVDICNKLGETALSIAARRAYHEFLEKLLCRGADVNARATIDGGTVLHAMCDYLRLYLHLHNGDLHNGEDAKKTMSVLLRWGADETAKDDDNNTPLDILHDHVPDDPTYEDVRNMLRRAPFDKAWYRRGWLVMLRTRVEDNEEEGEEEETADDDGTCSRQRQRGAGGGGGDGDDHLASVVHKLIEVEEHGVFRKVVGFL